MSLVSRPSYSGYSMCKGLRSRSLPSTSILMWISSSAVIASTVVTKKCLSRPSIFGFPCKDCRIFCIVDCHGNTSSRVGASPCPFESTGDSYDCRDFLLSGSGLREFNSECEFYWSVQRLRKSGSSLRCVFILEGIHLLWIDREIKHRFLSPQRSVLQIIV